MGEKTRIRTMDRRTLVLGGGALGSLAILAGLAPVAGCANASAAIVGDAVPSLRVGCDCTYPPYEALLDHEAPGSIPIDNIEGAWAVGYDVSWVNHLSQALGRRLYLVNIRREHLVERLRDGYVDLVISGVAQRSGGGEVSYSDPYGDLEAAILCHRDSPLAQAGSLADLSGARFVAREGTVLDSAIAQVPGAVHLATTADEATACDMVAQGTADATIVDAKAAGTYLATRADLIVMDLPASELPDLAGEGISVAVRAADTELLSSINDSIAKVGDAEREEMWRQAVELCEELL